MAKVSTATKKQALRAFRDALKEEWDLSIANGYKPTPDSGARMFERCFAEALKRALQGAPAVSIPGLGTFRRTKRKARRITISGGPDHPRQWLALPETHSVRFSPCGEWRRSLK